MTGQAILDTLEGQGITLTLEGDAVRVHGGRLSRAMQDVIRAHKDAVCAALQEREIRPEPPTITVEPSRPEVDEVEWSMENMRALYHCIADGSRRSLNWEVPKVPQVHKEAARKAVEALLDVGAAATMAAVVDVYKDKIERLKAGGTDVFPLLASLRLAAIHPKPQTFEPWYQELLDQGYARTSKVKETEILSGDYTEVEDEHEVAGAA